MADQQSRGKGPGNLARVDPDTLLAFSATYHAATNRRVFPAAPVPECPADARAAMLLHAKSDDYRDCQSLAEVATAAAMREGTARVDDALSAWVACRLCSREEMRSAWKTFERRRARAILDRISRRESIAAQFIGTAQRSACDAVSASRRAPRTKAWLAEWRADLGSAVEQLTSVLARDPSSDYVWRICKAEPDVTRRLSEALREFHAIELGLTDRLPKRRREHAPRGALAVTLSRWCSRFLDAECQSFVATVVSILFGVDYPTRQLRRDLADTNEPTT